MFGGSGREGDGQGASGQPPTDPVNHVPDSATSSESTPPDPVEEPGAGHSGTGVPHAAPDSAESLPPGDAGMDDPQEAMESGGGGRLLRRVRRFFSATQGRDAH